MNLNGGAVMICETEKRLRPGAACAVLFVHGILGSPAQFADVYKRQPCSCAAPGSAGGAPA